MNAAEIHGESCSCTQVIGPGFRRGRLTVTGVAARSGRSAPKWRCRCDCGATVDVHECNLQYCYRLGTKSCGCLARERMSKLNLTHGHTHGHVSTITHSTWISMIGRCRYPNVHGYMNYGGRGIRVCERWLGNSGFQNFLADMGERPSRRHSVDRLDVNGNYEPSNCRWATSKEQYRNKRNSHRVTAFGQSKTLVEWQESSGLPRGMIRARIMLGWEPERAISEEPGPTKKLTVAVAEEIRKHLAIGETRASLARRYGLSWSAVNDVMTNRRWVAK